MKSLSGQAMVPASICPFPHSMFFNDSVCSHQDRPKGVLHEVTESVVVAVALGCGEALDGGVGVGASAHELIVECSAVQAAKPIPAPTGARPPDGTSAKVPLLPLSILEFLLAAKEVQGVSKASSWSVLYYLC